MHFALCSMCTRQAIDIKRIFCPVHFVQSVVQSAEVPSTSRAYLIHIYIYIYKIRKKVGRTLTPAQVHTPNIVLHKVHKP